MNDDYEPFGELWENELMKFPKRLLIAMLKLALQKNIEQDKNSETDNA